MAQTEQSDQLSTFTYVKTIKPKFANDLIVFVQFLDNELIFADRKGCCEIWKNDGTKLNLATFNSETCYHRFHSFTHSTGIKIYLAHPKIGKRLSAWAPKLEKDLLTFDQSLSIFQPNCNSISLISSGEGELFIKTTNNFNQMDYYQLIVDFKQNGDMLLKQGDKVDSFTDPIDQILSDSIKLGSLDDFNKRIFFDEKRLNLSSVTDKSILSNFSNFSQINNTESYRVKLVYSFCETQDYLYLGHDGFISIWKR